MTTRHGTEPMRPAAPSPVALGLQHQAVAKPDRVALTDSERLITFAHLVVDDEGLTPVVARQVLELVLPAHLVPAVLMRHDRLPVTDRGKVDVATLRTMLPVPWRVRPPRKSYSEIERWIAGLVTRLVDLGEVGVDDDMWGVGLDSLGAVELCATIADAGHGEIQPTALMQHRTPAALGRFLTVARPLDLSPAVVLNANGTRPALFAIPGGGGTALAFRSLADALGADQPLVVVEPRGMHQPGTVALTIEAMAGHALECVDEGLGRGERCVVLGYSAGVTVALEVCRRLVEAGRPAHLVLLDAVPQDRRPEGLDEGLDEDLSGDTIPVGKPGNSGIAPDDLFAKRLSLFRGGAAYYEEFQRIMRRATAGYELRLVPVVATRFIRPPDTSNSWTRNASPTEGPTWLTSDQTCTWAQSSRGKAPGRSRRVCNTRQMSMRSPNGT